jgi:hypothetical protein
MNTFNSMQRNINNLGYVPTSREYSSITSYYDPGDNLVKYPCGICIDTNYNLFFANGRVLTATTGYLSRLTTDGTKARTDFRINDTTAITNFVGIGFDSNNNVYPTSYTNNAVYKYVPGATPAIATGPFITFTSCTCAAVDGSGNVFVGSSLGNVSVFLSGSIGTNNQIVTFGTGKTLYSAASNGLKANLLKCGNISGIFINKGKVYVCDATYGCIFFLLLTDVLSNYGNATITKFAGTGFYETQKTKITTNTSATSVNLSDIYSLCFDRADNAYLTELGGKSIRKITPEGLITTMVGSSVFTNNITIPAGMAPIGICIKNANNFIYVTDLFNNAIWELT